MTEWKPPPEVLLTEKILDLIGQHTHLNRCSCENNWTCAHCQLWFSIYALITEYTRERNAGNQPLA